MGGGANLPTPVGLDLPGADRLNLPGPKSGLDVQPADNLVAPANLDLEPAGTGLTPAELGLESRDAGGLAPREAGATPGAATADARPGYAQPKGPTPRALSDEGSSRKMLVYGVAALGLLAALGGGLYVAGVFDDAPDTSGQRGVAKSKKPAEGKGEDGGAKPTPGEAVDRSAEVLAQLDKDTPGGYLEAAKAAEAAGDAVGQAEALFLLHLRYGPDLESAKKGAQALEPFAKAEQPFVTRVTGLLAIINEKHDQAAKLLAGDGPRRAAYRGLAMLAQDKPAEAATEAKGAGDLALGKAIALEAQLASNPKAGYAALQAASKAAPEHLGIAMLLAEQAMQRGALRDAAAALAGVPVDGLPAASGGRLAALQGRVATAQGDYPTALANFKKALAASPKDTAVLEATVRSGIAGKQFAEATDAMNTLRSAAPDSVDVLLLGVELSVAAGRGDEALTHLDALAKAAPERIEIPYFRGEVQAMRLQLDDAKAEFTKVVEKDPTFYKVALAQASMLNAARMPVDAVAALDAGVARLEEGSGDASQIADLLTAKAKLQVEQKQTTAALAALDRALERAPTHNDAQVLRGVTRMSTGDREGGKADLLSVYERTGSYPGLVAPLGRLFAASGELDQLQELLGDRADDEKASAEIKLVAARLRLAQGKPEEAKKLASGALVTEPSSWEAQMLIAQAVLDAGDPQEALTRIEAVRTPQPVAEVTVLKGKILEFNGKHSDARVEYQRAVAIDPNNLEARFLHGRLLAYAGQAKQALGELEFVTSKTDGFPRAYLNIGRAQRDLGKNDEAVTAFAKALELDKSLLEAHYLTGRVYLERNRLGAAVSSLQAATADAAKGQTWYPEAWLFLGRAHDKSGKRAAAKKAFKTFLDVAPPDHSSRTSVQRTLEKL
jgi:tetratricopeptide (TPR) repeat protein